MDTKFTEENKTGILLNAEDIKIHRQYFDEMVTLIGTNVIYRSPKDGTHYDVYGEMDNFYNAPKMVGCIFNEHPNQWTTKKLGWNSESQEEVSIINVPYDLEKLQIGCLFIIPTGIDNAEGRVFKVLKMSNVALYPASIACIIAPVFTSTFQRAELDHKNSNFNIVKDVEEDTDERNDDL